MKKKFLDYVCQSCDYRTTKWMGHCPKCNEWNTFKEHKEPSKAYEKKTNSSYLLSSVDIKTHDRFLSGIDEFDKTVGGGLTKGSLNLIAGKPGVGKSTLLLNVLDSMLLKNNLNCLYVSGEESVEQIASRAKRLRVMNKSIHLMYEESWDAIKNEIKKIKPEIIIFDSIQTIKIDDLSSVSGSINQVRESTHEILKLSKEHGFTCFIVGHITKDGAIAGPKLLEHMVDTVLYFEGEGTDNIRTLRPVKNRYGSLDNIGFFIMKENGIGSLNMSHNSKIINNNLQIGISRGITLCSVRPYIYEVQSLVNDVSNFRPIRNTQIISLNRLNLIIAIIEKYLNLKISTSDIYLNIIGPLSSSDTEVDLSILVSLLSSYKSRAIDSTSIFIGSVGLNGLITTGLELEKHLNDLFKLGVKKVYTSMSFKNSITQQKQINILGVDCISEIVELL